MTYCKTCGGPMLSEWPHAHSSTPPADVMHKRIADAVPQIARGKVWCTVCKREQSVIGALALARGWPKCCGYTMTIDSPEERAALAAPQRN